MVAVHLECTQVWEVCRRFRGNGGHIVSQSGHTLLLEAGCVMDEAAVDPSPPKNTDPPRAPPVSNSLAQLESCDHRAQGVGALDGRLVLCGGSVVFNVRRLEECRLNAVAQVSKDGEVRTAWRRISRNLQSRK